MLAESCVYSLQVGQIGLAVVPRLGQQPFGGVVVTRKYRMDPVLCRCSIKCAENHMVSRHLEIEHGRFEIGPLQVTELVPVHDPGFKVEAKPSNNAFYVGNRQLGVPSIIEVHDERA